MRATRSLEIGTGLFVLLGFAALFFLTTQLPANGIRLAGGISPTYPGRGLLEATGYIRCGIFYTRIIVDLTALLETGDQTKATLLLLPTLLLIRVRKREQLARVCANGYVGVTHGRRRIG